MFSASKALCATLLSLVWTTSFTANAAPTSPRMIDDVDISRFLSRRDVVPDDQQWAEGQMLFVKSYTTLVAVNTKDTPWTTSTSANMIPGMYCNLISGKLENGVCTGNMVYVGFGGKIDLVVPPHSAIAIKNNIVAASPPLSSIPNPTGVDLQTHQTGETSSTPGMADVTFTVAAFASTPESLYVVGSATELGSSDTNRAINLSWTEISWPFYSTTVKLPINTPLEYQYIRKIARGGLYIEAEPKRSLPALLAATYNVADSWQSVPTSST